MNILNDCRVVFMVQKQTVSQFELASKQRDSTPGFSYSSRNRLMSGIILVVDNNFIYSPPSDGKPFRLSLGLRELQVENWIEGGSDLLDQLRQRNELLDTKREVVFQSVSCLLYTSPSPRDCS